MGGDITIFDALKTKKTFQDKTQMIIDQREKNIIQGLCDSSIFGSVDNMKKSKEYERRGDHDRDKDGFNTFLQARKSNKTEYKEYVYLSQNCVDYSPRGHSQKLEYTTVISKLESHIMKHNTYASSYRT